MNRIAGFVMLTAAAAVVAVVGCGGGGGGGGSSAGPSIPGRTFGGPGNDFSWSVQQTTDGGYIFAGFTNSKEAGGYDAWVVKTNSSGNVAQEKTFGNSGNDFAFSIQQTTDGGYIVAGVDNDISGSSPNSGVWLPLDFSGELTLRKLNTDLSQAWETKVGAVSSGGSGYPFSMGYAVQQTVDDGYIVAGATGTGAGGGQTLLIRVDASGTVLWNAFLDGEIGTGVRQAADNGYVVSTAGAGGNFLIKTGSGGAWEWNRALAGSGLALWNTQDGGFAVTGDNAASTGDVYLAKTDANGMILWERTFGSAGGDIGYSIQQVSDSGYILAGAGSGGGFNHLFDVYLVKRNAGGDSLWERYFGGTGDDLGRSVRQTSDGGYILAGSTNSEGAGGIDAYLVKTDSAGIPQW
jgi:hypothetical protein